MKKSYILLGLLALGFTTTFAQKRAGATVDMSDKFSANLLQAEVVNDTIAPRILPGCNVGPSLTASTNGGYVAGPNGYGDKEKAQGFLNVGYGNIYSAIVAFGAKKAGTGTGSINAKIYELTTMGPGNLTATSGNVSFADIDTSGNFTSFAFPNTVPFQDDFFMSVDFAGSGDTAGILHSNLTTACGGGLAWEKWSDDSWSDMSGWGGADPILYIFVEADVQNIGTNEHVIERGSHKVYPNPSTNEAHLIYSLVGDADNVVVDVFSINGQKVANYNRGSENAGLHGMDLNVHDLASGTYFYTITSDGDVAQGKFVVAE